MLVFDIKIEENFTSGVQAISLVKAPAIEENFVALSKDNKVSLKVNEDKQELIGPVLIPDKLILRRSGEKEYYIKASADVIKQIANKFIKASYQKNITHEHKDNLDVAFVSETWIKEYEQDKSNSLGYDLPIGTWFAKIKIEDENYWNNQVKTGLVQGFSIEGFLDFVEPDELTIANPQSFKVTLKTLKSVKAKKKNKRYSLKDFSLFFEMFKTLKNKFKFSSHNIMNIKLAQVQTDSGVVELDEMWRAPAVAEDGTQGVLVFIPLPMAEDTAPVAEVQASEEKPTLETVLTTVLQRMETIEKALASKPATFSQVPTSNGFKKSNDEGLSHIDISKLRK